MVQVASRTERGRCTINGEDMLDIQHALIDVQCAVDNVDTIRSILHESSEDINHWIEHFVGKEKKIIHMAAEKLEKRLYVLDVVFAKLKEQTQKTEDLVENLAKIFD